MRDCRNLFHGCLFLIAASVPLLAGCGDESADLPKTSIRVNETTASNAASVADEEPVSLTPNHQDFQSPARSQEERFPEVVITTSLGDIRVRLNADKAPRSVANFVYNYVEPGFYDQTVIHYVKAGYMLAAGGYTVTLDEKKPETPIPCEAANGLKNRRGTIAMVRDPDFVNSATSQFFINLVDNPSLDYQPPEDGTVNGYCVFGEVISGMDVVDKIAQVEVHDKGDFVNTPVTPVVIESIKRVK